MTLSPEWQLLLACAKTHLTPDERQRLLQRLVDPTLDWPRMAERACYHGIAPLLYHHLQRLGSLCACAPEALAVMKHAYYGTAIRNGILFRALGDVLPALQRAGCRMIVLKGGALAETVYPNKALRPMSDLDLLIRKADLPRVEALLVPLGYRLNTQRDLTSWQETHHDPLVFVQPSTGMFTPVVEIHWHIERPGHAFAIDLEGLWARAVSVRVAGVGTLALAPEDLLLHLCLHTCRHATAPLGPRMLNFRLRSFGDMAEVIRQAGPALEWAALVRRAHAWRAQPYVYFSLELARTLLGAAVPESVLADLQPAGFDARLLAWAQADLLEEPGSVPIFPDLLRLWKGRRVHDRVAVMAKILSPSAVAKAYGLSRGSIKVYGYYPVRLKDLLRRYGPVLWRLLRHDQQLRAVVDGKAQLAAWLTSGWRQSR